MAQLSFFLLAASVPRARIDGTGGRERLICWLDHWVASVWLLFGEFMTVFDRSLDGEIWRMDSDDFFEEYFYVNYCPVLVDQYHLSLPLASPSECTQYAQLSMSAFSCLLACWTPMRCLGFLVTIPRREDRNGATAGESESRSARPMWAFFLGVCALRRQRPIFSRLYGAGTSRIVGRVEKGDPETRSRI
jgi:hypothetical protein